MNSPENSLPVAVAQPQPEPSQSLLPTAQQMRSVEVSRALEPAYAKASTLKLTDTEVEALTARFPDSAVEIRPHDGLIYLPHIHISNRLNQVLKPGKWALLRRGAPWVENGTMFAEYVLLIRGCLVGESIGGHAYQPNNPKTNYSDTLESTAAEALRRIAGKRLSCGDQVWDPAYARDWVQKHAVRVAGRWERRFTEESKAPGEPIASAERVNPNPPAKTYALRPDVTMPPPDNSSVIVTEAFLREVRQASGMSKRGPWTAWFGVFEREDMEAFEAGTFSRTVARDLEALKGHAVTVSYKPGKREGTFELVSIIDNEDDLDYGDAEEEDVESSGKAPRSSLVSSPGAGDDTRSHNATGSDDVSRLANAPVDNAEPVSESPAPAKPAGSDDSRLANAPVDNAEPVSESPAPAKPAPAPRKRKQLVEKLVGEILPLPDQPQFAENSPFQILRRGCEAHGITFDQFRAWVMRAMPQVRNADSMSTWTELPEKWVKLWLQSGEGLYGEVQK